MSAALPLPSRLVRAIPIAEIYVGRTNLHAMLAGIAHELSRLVEAHGLAVEDRRTECVGVVPLDPGGHIDQQREAGRVALGKAVFAEPFDLIEAAFGELSAIAVLDHAGNKLLAKRMNRADVTEGRHCPPQ